MHWYTPFLSSLAFFLIASLSVQVTVAQENEFEELEMLFLDDIQTEFTQVASAETSEVLQHSLYQLAYTPFSSLIEDSGRQLERERIVYEHEGQLYAFWTPTTNMDMPFFDNLVDPDFRLDESSASAFRDLLITVSGDDFFESVDTDDIQYHDGEWVFLTGTFFSDYKGYVVHVDDTGHVEGVSYDLNYMSQ